MLSENEEQQPLKQCDDDEDAETFKLSSDLSILCDEYEVLMNEYLSIFNQVKLLAFGLAFDYALRSNIFILYAKTFDDYGTTTNIGIVVLMSYIVSGLTSLINGIIGDKWNRFDILLCIAALSDIIFFWLEATADSFVVLAIAYTIGGQPIQSIVFGWSVKTLPSYYSKNFQTQWYQVYLIGLLLGPIIGGIIGYYVNYRSVFIVSAVFAMIIFILLIYKVAGKQERIVEMENIIINQYYKNDKVIEFGQICSNLKTLGSVNNSKGSTCHV